MPLLKPGPWTVDPSQLEPLGQELSRGLVDLLPLWDDDVTNVADGVFPLSTDPKYGWTDGAAPLTRGEPTSMGVGWKGVGTAGGNIESDRDLHRENEYRVDDTQLVMMRLDSATIDSGICGGGNDIWWDTFGGALRIGYFRATVVYSSTIHTTADNGTVYVIVIQHDYLNTNTRIWVDGEVVIDTAQRNSGGFVPLRVGSRAAGSSPLTGALVTFARWNHLLTDTEVQTLSIDPFLLLRPAILLKTEVVDDRSGSGSITETHTVVGEGRKDASNTGAISHGHTVVGQGDKAASDTGSISHGHTTVGEGMKAGSGIGDISRGHTVVATGIKKVSDTSSISHGHTVEGQGDKAASDVAAISHGHTVVATGIKKVSGVSSISHGHIVVAEGQATAIATKSMIVYISQSTKNFEGKKGF